MKILFQSREVLNFVFNIITAILVSVVLSYLRFFSTIELIIMTLLIFIALTSISSHFYLGNRVDELTYKLTHQLTEGNPNAIFQLSDQNQALTRIISNAQFDILFVGTSFVGFLSQESHVIIQSLERGLKVRILLLAPSTNILQEQEDRQFSRALEKEYEYSLLQLEKIKQLTSGLKGTLEIRLSRFPFTISGLQSDVTVHSATILISLFTPTTTSEVNLPYFVINKRTSAELFNNFSRYLELVWKNSNLIQKDATLTQND